MSYVVAGYVICLTVLALYAVGLVLRRRRLERAAALLDAPGPEGVLTGTSGGPDGTGAPPDVVPPATDGER
ncbi:MAG TPA: hypothetical protein VMB82_11125 [Acidimicrobiales bacterium]|nr:hypothetical protein [Acidimicrobiales bacterium]